MRRRETVQGSISNVVAGCFSLTAFAVALIAGLAGDNEAANVLFRALIAMILGYPVGLVAGMVCARAIDARIQNGRSAPQQQDATPRSCEPQIGDSVQRGAGQMISM